MIDPLVPIGEGFGVPDTFDTPVRVSSSTRAASAGLASTRTVEPIIAEFSLKKRPETPFSPFGSRIGGSAVKVPLRRCPRR